ncbi:MAG: DEAD/DEAH box helicase [bacterium]|nr:DEAD/DEAH box helicase [bacterium]
MSYSYRTNKARSFSGGRPRNNFSKSRSNRGFRGDYIDPSRFVKAATFTEADAYEPINKFSDFALAPLLQANLKAVGYVVPSPIQDQAIPLGLVGSDVIGIASTGTGKTAAFALPVLQKLMSESDSYAIIIAPTRELAQQIEDECRVLAKGSGLTGTLLIGGTNMSGQLRDLRNNPRIVIGTPGRIKDHLERGSLRLQKFNAIVLDEVDRMLDMGFVNDVTTILSHASPTRQSFFFSATMDARVRTLIDNFTNNPVTISLKASAASENVHQDVVRFQTNSDKIEKLHELLILEHVTKVIVFDETQRSVERLSNELASRGFSAESIHGGKSQGQRQRALNKFKRNEIKVLVATDVAARGIDVSDISHVVNYSIPKVYDDYIHRIGRAGRAGQIGYALTFVAH